MTKQSDMALQKRRKRVVAERPDDRVVALIKRSRALKGANDLRERAVLVDGQPGWRLELIAAAGENEDSAMLSHSGWLEGMLRQAGTDATTNGMHVVFLDEVLGVVIRGPAARCGIRSRDKTALRVARELTFQGVIDQDVLDRIESAFEWQRRLLHDVPLRSSPADQASEVIALCRQLNDRSMNETDLAA